MKASRIKVLFFAEGATLAQLVRPLALARLLDPERFDVTFCRPVARAWLTADAAFRIVDLAVLPEAQFARRRDNFSPLYDYATLKRYVDDDLTLIDDIHPQVIVGDSRLSLSVSARLRVTPYMALCDACLSPENGAPVPLPVFACTRYLPIALIEPLFRAVSGIAMRYHALPLERLRAHYGLPSLGYDVLRGFSDADLRLFASIPMLFPKLYPGADAAYIGPITGFPSALAAPAFFDDEGPLVYVTLGSSGSPRLLTRIVTVLERLDCQVIVATAGKVPSFKPASERTRIFDYLPGELVCRHAQLVVCNGGSAAANQALANGVPVLGIARSIDQLFNMRAVESFGAGLLVRADRASSARLREAADELLREWWFTERAQKLAASVAPESVAAVFSRHVASTAISR